MKSKLLLVTAFLLLLLPSADAQSFREKLLAIDGVISVEEIEQDEKVFEEKYIVTIEQPVNWADPQSEMFPQRFEIGYQSDDSPNLFYLSGYMLSDGRFKQDDRPELAKMYNTNYIRCEYRFYSKSAPEDLSRDNTKYWLYLNEKNAAQDFHRIIDELKDILTGKWIFTGVSKGGKATAAFATYYPHDADVYVPSVAPFADEATGVFTQNLYETIGNERYGSELAAKYRSELLEFQIEAVKNRSYMQDVFWRNVESGDVKVRPFVNKQIMFDMIILEFTVTTWQYDQNFEAIEKVLAMPREDDPSTETDEKRAFQDAMIKCITDANVGSYVWGLDYLFQYYVQAATEMGEHDYNFDYLRKALAADGSGAELAITPDMDKDILYRMMFTDEQMEAFTFSPDTRNRIYEWIRTTDSKVIFLYGTSDPWYSLSITEDDLAGNTHVKIIADPNQSHSFKIANLPEEMRNEIISIIDEAIIDDRGVHSKNSSGCNLTGTGLFLIILIMMVMTQRRKTVWTSSR